MNAREYRTILGWVALVAACGSSSSKENDDTGDEGIELTDDADSNPIQSSVDAEDGPTDAPSGSSGTVPPPAAAGVAVQMSGSLSINAIIPRDDPSGRLSRISIISSERELAEVPLVQDGDATTVRCTVQEVSMGTYNVSLYLEADGNEIIADALEANNAGTGPLGSLSLRIEPNTAGTVFASDSCQVQVGAANEGGDSIVASFTCEQLNDTGVCDKDTAECSRSLRGLGAIFVKNCEI